MAYSFQTFSVGQILTAGQMNQVEVNIRDHQHGVAGVSGSGMTFASPVFTTQISTPKIVSASGNLEITPAGNANIILQGSGSGNVGIGTTNPGYTLDVAGTVYASGAIGVGGAASNAWIYKPTANNTASGSLTIQSGAGSAGYGGALVLYSHSHATHPGDVVAGISSGSGGKFRVNSFATDGGVDYLVCTSTGLGIGVTSPLSTLHLKAGSATANTAPLQFNSGPVEGTPRAGVVEFLTDAWYGTITTGAARKTFAFLESPVFTTPNIGSATGSVSGNAGSATVLATGRNINGVSFDGSANITVTAAADTLTGTTLNSTVVASSLTSVGVLSAGTVPLARMGTVVANSSTAVGANSDTTVNITSSDQVHKFYSYSLYNSTNTTDTGYSAIVTPSEGVYAWFHAALVHAKTVGRVLRLCNGSAASITCYYKIYELTET